MRTNCPMMLLQANNILVGWSPRSLQGSPLTLAHQGDAERSPSSAATAVNAAVASTSTRRADTLNGILGDLAAPTSAHLEEGRRGDAPISDVPSSSTPPQSPPSWGVSSIPHKALTTAIDLSLALPGSQPVALLAGFYRGQHFKQVWGKCGGL